ncbi:MAG: thioesterase [Breznakibacter sp.]
MNTPIEPLATTLLLSASDVDIRNRLKLSSLFLMMQNAAAQHAKMCGFGFEHLDLQDCFWVLSRAKVAMRNLPECDDEITISTWPVGTDKLFALRDFVFTASNGIRIGAATTSWLILNKNTFRPQRPDALNGLIYPNLPRPFTSDAPKINGLQEKQISHSQTAYYSDIDMNRHVNNATYVDWMLNSLGPQELPDAPFSFCINFTGQAVWGDRVDVYKHPQEHSTMSLEIRKGDVTVTGAQLVRHDTDACLFA